MKPEAITIDYFKNHEAGILQLATYAYRDWRQVYDRVQMSFDAVAFIQSLVGEALNALIIAAMKS